MTCDGKSMLVTRRELGAMALANGGDPEEAIERWGVGVTWLAMTYETASRWCNGVEYESRRPDVQAMMRAEADRWYA
jgi:hypothetical protein